MDSFIDLTQSGLWLPTPANASPSLIGMEGLTLAGCAANAHTPAFAATYDYKPRVRYLSSSSAAATVMTMHQATPFLFSQGHPATDQGISPLAGFSFRCVFGMADTAYSGSRRAFIGLAAGGTALTSVNPSTLTNLVGIGHNSGDTTWSIYCAGAVAQAATATPVSCAANSRRAHIYDLTIHCDFTVLTFGGSDTYSTMTVTFREITNGIGGGAATKTFFTSLNHFPRSDKALGFSAMRANVGATTQYGLDLFKMAYTV